MTVKTIDDLWAVYSVRRVLGKKSAPETVRLYETHVAPALGQKRVDKITFLEIDDLHAKLRETPYQANRVLALLRPMFKFAGAMEIVPAGHNPAGHVKQFPEKKRRRHMRRAEAPKIAHAIAQYEYNHPDATLFLWLLIFTGARSGELKRATWGDLKGNVLTLKEHKTADRGNDRTIVLPPAAMTKLNKLASKDRRPERKIIAMAAPQYLWQRKIRREAGCPDLRIHDLRHTFATYATERGFTLAQIGEALGHSSLQTTKIYTELTSRSHQRLAIDASVAMLLDMEVAFPDETGPE